MKSENKKIILAMVITFIFSSIVSVTAAGHLFDSREVVYDNSNSGMSSTNVKDAVDELYAAASDYTALASRVTSLESYFDNNPTSVFDGHDLEIAKNESGNNHAYVDFWRNGVNRGGVGVDGNTGNTVLLAKNENSQYGTGTLELRANNINIGTNATVKINGTNLIDLIYPVGSIYISVTDTTTTAVQNRFPGTTWQAFGSGRTIVGVNSSDSDFSTVQKTGGAKAHQHSYGFQYAAWWGSVSLEANPYSGLLNYNSSNSISLVSGGTSVGNNEGSVNGGSLGSNLKKGMTSYRLVANTSNVSNVMPYITVYMYKRTA